MKSILALLVAVVFALGVVGLTIAADCKGTVAKIDGKNITCKDDKGKETTVVGDAKGFKVGDKVDIKDGVVLKASIKPKKAIEGC